MAKRAAEARPALAVLGAGSWGTALAAHLAKGGHPTRLWGRDPAQLADMAAGRRNRRYLPDIELPSGLEFAPERSDALAGVDQVLIATPSHTFRSQLREIAPLLGKDTGVIWACKGLEPETGSLLSRVASEELGEGRDRAVVSGPTFAGEVARGLPAAMAVAANHAAYAERVARLFHHGNLRAYTSDDLVGVQLGGALKNVLAVAAGISDGLGFGANARAALITRGLWELAQLGTALGGRRQTFMGLAGMGDLVLTCTDNQSRNRRFGLLLAEGVEVEQARARIAQAVEGIRTTLEAHHLAQRLKVEAPIIEQVHAVIYAQRPPLQAVQALLSREQRAEWD